MIVLFVLTVTATMGSSESELDAESTKSPTFVPSVKETTKVMCMGIEDRFDHRCAKLMYKRCEICRDMVNALATKASVDAQWRRKNVCGRVTTEPELCITEEAAYKGCPGCVPPVKKHAVTSSEKMIDEHLEVLSEKLRRARRH